MVEVYNHTGVLAPEDRPEDCAPWLYHELGWRPPTWLVEQRGRLPQELSWPAAVVTQRPRAVAVARASAEDWLDLPY
jgi:hypothetical protein